LVTLAALSPGLSGCGDAGALDGLAAGRQGRVSAVLSGDTLELDGVEQVRLAGVEAPRPDDPYGQQAATLIERLTVGQTVTLLHGGAKLDADGSTVAQVRTVQSRRWLQGAMIDAGAARVRTSADNRALAKLMLAKEAGARAARRGLWALDDYRVLLPTEVEPWARGLVLVEGRVARAGRTEEGDVYLDFDREWRGGLSADIPKTALRDFRSARLDPLDLQGRLVRVRGAVERLRLILDHPEQVEPLRDV
jgi:endonuclease YncB( thermonuclease family)